MLAKKTALIALFCFTVYCLVSSATSPLLAGEPTESKVNAQPLDRIAKAKPDLELVNFTPSEISQSARRDASQRERRLEKGGRFLTGFSRFAGK